MNKVFKDLFACIGVFTVVLLFESFCWMFCETTFSDAAVGGIMFVIITTATCIASAFCVLNIFDKDREYEL